MSTVVLIFSIIFRMSTGSSNSSCRIPGIPHLFSQVSSSKKLENHHVNDESDVCRGILSESDFLESSDTHFPATLNNNVSSSNDLKFMDESTSSSSSSICGIDGPQINSCMSDSLTDQPSDFTPHESKPSADSHLTNGTNCSHGIKSFFIPPKSSKYHEMEGANCTYSSYLPVPTTCTTRSQMLSPSRDTSIQNCTVRSRIPVPVSSSNKYCLGKLCSPVFKVSDAERNSGSFSASSNAQSTFQVNSHCFSQIISFLSPPNAICIFTHSRGAIVY